MDMGMICSGDMLVMGNEVAGFIKRFAGGISTEPDQLALGVIQKVGAGGNYLQERHTFQHFKSCWYPELFARGSYAGWEAAGKKNLADKCNEKVRQILETHTPIPLAQPLKETVAQIRKTGEKRIMTQMVLNA